MIKGKILDDTHADKTAFISRISLKTSQSSDLSFTLHRRQLFIRFVFAITINKSQDQSFKIVDIHLANSSVFAHDQLYVAIS